MNCATSTIKYLVFTFNILCALLGIGSIVVSSLELKNVSDTGKTICIFMIILGTVVFLISFFGCCGAARESPCFIWTYAVFLLILVVLNAVIIFGYLSHIDGETLARKEIDATWAKQINGTDAMSALQDELHCCGKEGAQDYINANLQVPTSCYVDHNNSTNIYTDGCLKKLIDIYEKAEKLVVIFSWSTWGVECFALLCAVILGIAFRNEERRSRY